MDPQTKPQTARPTTTEDNGSIEAGVDVTREKAVARERETTTDFDGRPTDGRTTLTCCAADGWNDRVGFVSIEEIRRRREIGEARGDGRRTYTERAAWSAFSRALHQCVPVM